MTIFVTGGTGLVGSRLLPRLVDAGIDCRALVRAGKELSPGVIPVEGDLSDPATFGHALEGVSAIVHLAAVLRTPDPELIWAANLQGTRNLIDVAKRHAPDARFVMASTGLVYGADSPRPGREDDDVDPKQDYPASKVAAEAELRASGLNWSVLRFGFVYGDADGHLESLPGLAKRFGLHPASRLSMIHHRDIATLVRLALDGALDATILNTADEATMSVYELCELVGDPVEASSEPLVNPWWGVIDATRARRLGFRPSVATVYQAAREGAL